MSKLDNKSSFELFMKTASDLQNCPDFPSLDRTLRSLCAYLGLDGYTWVFLDGKGELIELDTRPTEWKKRYDDGVFFYQDPVVQTSAVRASPFRWDDMMKVIKLSPAEWSVMNQARDYSITEGFNFPVHEDEFRRGCLSFYSDDLDTIYGVWQDHSQTLHYISFVCLQLSKHLAAQAGVKPWVPDEKLLNEKERTVLTLAAMGQSAPEIANNIKLSTDGVKARIKNSFKKLEAKTMAQACIKATLSEQIYPYPFEFQKPIRPLEDENKD